MSSTESLIRDTASATLAVASATSSSSVKAQEAAAQTALTVRMPLFLWLAVVALIVLTLFTIQVPFLVRLYASLGVRISSSDKRATLAPFEKAGLVEAGHLAPRVVAGGGLFTGWIFRGGKQVSPASTMLSSTMSSRGPTPPNVPPPREQNLLAKLPMAHLRNVAPLSKLPDVFASPINLVGFALVLCYLVIVGLCMIFRSDLSAPEGNSGYGNDFARTGLLAAAQLPLVFLLGTRNNLLALLVGRSYEKLKVLHKIVGKLIFLCSTLHVAFFLNKWAQANIVFQQMGKPFVVAGLVAWLAQVVIVITALPWMRQFCWGVFEISHMLGMITLLVGLSFHVDAAKPWCICAALIYGVSLLASLLKTRTAIAHFQAHPEGGSTTIHIPSLRTGWRAGQHVRIRVPSLPFPHNLEAHPFSIASAANADGLKLVIKAIPTGWSSQLLRHAVNGMGETGVRTGTVILEGPYGGFGNILLESYSSVLLLAGGSGISHSLGVATHLVQQATKGVVRARTVDLVWITRSEPEARHLLSEMSDLVRHAKRQEEVSIDGRRKGKDLAAPVALRVEVYFSRSLLTDPLPGKIAAILSAEHDSADPFDDDDPFSDPSDAEMEKRAYLSRSASTSSRVPGVLSKIEIRPRKPHFDLLVGSIVAETATRCREERRDANGVLVVPCGPKSMVNDVRAAVTSLQWWEHESVQGVEYHEERFGF